MARVATTIPGFDDLCNGGLLEGSSCLIAGGPGTGKTIFAQQYIYGGAKLHKEPGLFVTIEGNLKNIAWNMKSFAWDIKALEDNNLMKIYKMSVDPGTKPEQQIKVQLKVIEDMVKDMGAKRLAVDSTTAFGLWMPEQAKLRHTLFTFADFLKELNCTTVMTAETKGGRTDFSAFGVEEFISDSVVALYFTPPNRSIFVRKMRGTDHDKNLHPFSFTKTGINVSVKDKVLWDAIK